MRKTLMGPLAGAGALSLFLFVPGMASAQDGFAGEGSGSATVTFAEDSDEADISVDWEGLAPEIPDLSGTDFEELSNMPFPHAQHIHAGADGVCPGPQRDADGNGVVDTVEGVPDYGPVVTSLTNDPGSTGPEHTLDVENFPAGGSTSYERTIDLGEDVDTDAGSLNPAELVRDENAVIVIHGLNPAIMPGETALEESRLDPAFPLAATAPALCGELVDAGDGTFTADLQQVNVVAMPDEVDTGAGGASDNGGLGIGAAVAAVVAAGLGVGLFVRRQSVQG